VALPLIDHLALRVRDERRSRTFYEQALVHVADRATVDKFHRAAVEAGGRDNGAPGLRPHYHAGYYAAFVLDPDGNNVEAVFQGDRQVPAT
jgi:catechol 2,3-dioxygenase-like lactoylglutathione lyase family enzyme